MSTKKQCDRCGALADMDLCAGWIDIEIGVRGSNDATNRSDLRSVKEICLSCDNELYAWFYAR